MDRLSPEFVADMFKEHNITPMRGRFGDGRLKSACALGVCAYAAGMSWAELESFRLQDKIFGLLGLTRDYAFGYLDGFDDIPIYGNPSNDYIRGHADGVEAWSLSTGSKDAPAELSSENVCVPL